MGLKWKMSVNPYPEKQGQEVIFCSKRVKDAHPSVFFNNDVVEQSANQNHLGIYLMKN